MAKDVLGNLRAPALRRYFCTEKRGTPWLWTAARRGATLRQQMELSATLAKLMIVAIGIFLCMAALLFSLTGRPDSR